MPEYTTFAELKVGDLMSDPETGYSGTILSINPDHQYSGDGKGDVFYEIDTGNGPGDGIFMFPTASVVIYR